VVKVGEDFYVLASSLASRRTTRVLANAQSFTVFDTGGDIIESPLEALGFFRRDTRYLSHFELDIDGNPPYFLNSYISDDKAELRVNLTNPDLGINGDVIELPRASIQIQRSWVLTADTLFHRLIVSNFASSIVKIPLAIAVGADFADVFEVRGITREHHGEFLETKVDAAWIKYTYRGLDGLLRFTEVVFDPPPAEVTDNRARYSIELKPHESATYETRIMVGSARGSSRGSGKLVPVDFKMALAERSAGIAAAHHGWARFGASNKLFDSFLQRSIADLTSIVTETADGAFIMAGIPWFATLFGRDSIVTSMSLLPFNPDIASRTLKTLAGLQGSEVNEARDEQPGKIVHETRHGEMAATGEIPFGRYYGSADSTPLFLWLLGRWVETTGDLKLADELWPNAMRALEWIEKYGDVDGDGYVEYIRQTPRGLANQGWKDSFDAISHADGELARAPIALAEIQGYVYAGYLGVAKIARKLAHADVADRLLERASVLKRHFVRDYWWDHERSCALALDGDKRSCRVVASNAGHVLATGLLDDDQALAQSERLLADDMFSGWGTRTLGANERRYNPMSYHNGSVWPHDNAIAALGHARAGNNAGVLKILDSLFDASEQLDGNGSLPELFCGFPRELHRGPVPYPVACNPQAWSAASVFMIMQAMLGLEISGIDKKVIFNSPTLPQWLDWLRIDDLKVGDGQVSFLIRRTTNQAAVEIVDRQGLVKVEVRQ
jgi:glycogen debranching enzyme